MKKMILIMMAGVIVVFGISAFFIFKKFAPLSELPEPNLPTEKVGKCGDGICDEFERANPGACPADCLSASSSQQAQSSSFPGNDAISIEINPKDYSLVGISTLRKSFKNASGELLECDKSSILQDRRLVKGNEIIIPSLIDLIHNSEEEKKDKKNWDCDMVVSEFLIPANGRYLYLNIRYLTFNESRASDFYIYRLDLSNLSIKRLFSSISDTNHEFRNDEYKLLSDEKRVVQWNSSGVYLADLEKDTLNNLYAAPQNQWLISRAEETEVMAADKYNIEISENQIKVGVYDKNKFQDNKTESGYLVRNYNLVNQITIPIPAN